MKIPFAKSLGRIAGLMIVTAFAIAVMIISGGKWSIEKEPPKTQEVDPEAEFARSLAPVQAMKIEQESLEILDRYAGIIQPFERYVISMEIAGRLETLGTNADDRMLDVGDEVKKGQILATLDRRVLTAQLAQARANLEKAQSDYNRFSELKRTSPGAVTESTYQEALTQQTLAEATKDIAEKNLEDATLYSPVNGVISKRLVNPGQSVNIRQQIFEIVEVDRVLLSIGVPESRIVEIQRRFNQVRQNRKAATNAIKQGQVSRYEENDLKFKVYVQALAKNRYGENSKKIVGDVYRISETADELNSLFHVQIVLENSQRLLKPGLVGMASLVVDEISGYRLPVDAVIFRDEGNHAFFIEELSQPSEVEFLNWKLTQQPKYVARKVMLEKFIEQDAEFLIQDLPTDLSIAIIRGQHRLSDGRPIQLLPQVQKDTIDPLADNPAGNLSQSVMPDLNSPSESGPGIASPDHNDQSLR